MDTYLACCILSQALSFVKIDLYVAAIPNPKNIRLRRSLFGFEMHGLSLLKIRLQRLKKPHLNSNPRNHKTGCG